MNVGIFVAVGGGTGEFVSVKGGIGDFVSVAGGIEVCVKVAGEMEVRVGEAFFVATVVADTGVLVLVEITVNVDVAVAVFVSGVMVWTVLVNVRLAVFVTVFVKVAAGGAVLVIVAVAVCVMDGCKMTPFFSSKKIAKASTAVTPRTGNKYFRTLLNNSKNMINGFVSKPVKVGRRSASSISSTSSIAVACRLFGSFSSARRRAFAAASPRLSARFLG